jgi:hypothetical protein
MKQRRGFWWRRGLALVSLGGWSGAALGSRAVLLPGLAEFDQVISAKFSQGRVTTPWLGCSSG